MSQVENQIKQHFPAVYVTLLSIVIALAVERLFSRMTSFDAPPGLDLGVVLVYLQSFAVFELAVCIWFLSSLFVITVRWVLGFSDAVGPFALLFLFNLLISSIGPEQLHVWLYVSGIGCLASAAILAVNLRKGAREPDNQPFFRTETFRAALAATVGLGLLMLAFGIAVHGGVLGLRGAVFGVAVFCIGLGAAVRLWYVAWKRFIASTRRR